MLFCQIVSPLEIMSLIFCLSDVSSSMYTCLLVYTMTKHTHLVKALSLQKVHFDEMTSSIRKSDKLNESDLATLMCQNS